MGKTLCSMQHQMALNLRHEKPDEEEKSAAPVFPLWLAFQCARSCGQAPIEEHTGPQSPSSDRSRTAPVSAEVTSMA
jgi:hypothetical protein